LNLKNYKLISKEYIEDVASEAYLYEHKSGARLVWLKNDEKDCVFVAGFRTLPNNNKGLPHITEHTVLCGSENYRVKDPFNILDKGSIHTYLNAVTYGDKTVYPVASPNKQDFDTLVRVYLDAVFKPLIYENEGIFRQEGWNSDGKSYNGIVLNEMKGVFASPDRVLSRAVKKELLKGSGHEFYSGGIPEDITDISYEEFLRFHKEKYHPSNGLFMFYGDVDTQKYAELIDDYIGEAERREYKPSCPKVRGGRQMVETEAETSGENLLNVCYALPELASDYAGSIMLDILSEYICNNEQSPLKQALTERGICTRVEAYYDDSSNMPIFGIEGYGSEENDLDRFTECVDEVWQSLCDNGVDEYQWQSVINGLKFFFKAENFGYKPKGLFYLLMLQKSLLYGSDSFEPLKLNKLFEELKTIDIKELIARHFIGKGCFGILRNKKADKPIKSVCAANNQPLIDYQAQTDSPLEVAKLKLTDIALIDRRELWLESEKTENGLIVPVSHGDIIYLDVMFDTSAMATEDLSLLGVYEYMAAVFDPQLATDIGYYTGELSVYFTTLALKGGGFKPVLTFSVSCLRENIAKAIELLQRVAECRFDDNDRLKTLLDEQRQYILDSYISGGASKAYNSALAMVCEDYSYEYRIGGYPLYKLVNSDISAEELGEKLRGVYGSVIGSDNMQYTLSCENRDRAEVTRLIEGFRSSLPKGIKGNGQTNGIELNNRAIAFATSGEVVNNALACVYNEQSGVNRVVRQLITSQYLWDRIRLEGGAYGGGGSFLRGKCFYMYSYRDPEVNKSYEVFANLGDYLCNSSFTQEQVDRFIIGAVNTTDKPLKQGEYNALAVRRYYAGSTRELLDRRREEMLSAKPKDIREIGEKLNLAIKEGCSCSVGNGDKLKASGIFKEIVMID
jgi:hypothetical protein